MRTSHRALAASTEGSARALEAVWKRRIEQECAEAQRKGTREFVGAYGSFSFHLPPDGPSAPLRPPVKTAFPDSLLAKNGTGIIAGPLQALRCLMMMGAMIGMLALTGCGPEARWTRADLFSQTEAARSQQVVDASRVSVAFLGGVQRGLNLKLDEAVKTDQGVTQYIYLEQPVQLPTGITLMKRFRVHFDLAGSPLYIEEIVRSPVK